MNYIQAIKNFEPINEQEQNDKKLILNFIEKNNDVLYRENEYAHMTSSGLIFNKNLDKILMVHHNIYNTWSWTGGHADGEDDLLKVAIKEAKEETGVNVIEIKKDLSSNQVYLSPGMTDESAAFVYCICDGEVSKDYLEDDEDIEAILISQDEAKDILKNSSTPLDIRVYLALQSFALMGEKMFL